MKPEPFSFQHSVSDFDLKKLPMDAALLREDPEMLASAVQAYYEECFRKLGGSAAIAVQDGVVSVAWYPKTGDAAGQIFDHALNLLRQGDRRTAEPLLRALIARDANHGDALYNLGMLLSDQQQLEEAIRLLRRFVDLVPDSSNGWTALGVAQSRNGDVQSAADALTRALQIDPQNAHALRNLGSLFSQGSPEEALPVLEKAARLMPDDQRAQYGYARCLLALGRTKEADPMYVKTIDLDPLSEIAELARKARTDIAHETLRAANDGGLRPDAVFYCLEGLQKFRDLGDTQARAIVFEIAMLGRNGLDINDPEQKYVLKSLPGKYSGLHLVSLMYTGIKLFDPDTDAGIDLSKEYAEARKMFEKEEGNES